MIGCAEHSPAKMRNGQPQKIIGPQYAVTIATNTPEQVMTSRRARFIFNPRFRAYASPSNKRFNVLTSRKESGNNTTMIHINKVI